MDPPVSVAVAPRQRRAATAAAEPLEIEEQEITAVHLQERFGAAFGYGVDGGHIGSRAPSLSKRAVHTLITDSTSLNDSKGV